MKLLIDIPEHIYEHAKETTEDSRDEFDAMRAIANGTQQESRSEIPNTCGDAISREEAVNAIYDLCGENVSLKENPWRDNPHMDAVVDALENLPSVTPQQRTGRWIEEGQGGRYKWMCSNCGTHHRALYDYCPSCGTRMEVEDAD